MFSNVPLYFLMLCKIHLSNANYISDYQRDCTFKHRCDSGECIQAELLCNGISDCSDKSDETVQACGHMSCPRGAYTCKYGACVERNAKCNGITDCVDGSDEVGCNAGSNADSAHETHRNGPSTSMPHVELLKYQCHSGEFIQEELLCDGIPDCPDKSDETVEACGHIVCPRSMYRCKYGACVKLSAKCNGITDCVDGSDEVGCYTGNNAHSTHETNRNGPSKSMPPVLVNCLIPNSPENGMYIIGGRESDPFQTGDTVPAFSVLVTNCDYGYQTSPPGTTYSVCANGIWTPIPSECSNSPQSTKSANLGTCECHCPLVLIK